MTISMYKVSVPVFLRNLNALNGVLDKAAAFAEARKLDQAVLLGLASIRHVPAGRAGWSGDDAMRRAASRNLAGSTQPTFDGGETTIAALKDRVSKTIES